MMNGFYSTTVCILVFLCILTFTGRTFAEGQLVRDLNRAETGKAAADTAGFSNGLQAFLDDVAKKEKWKTSDVMALVPQLQMYREELKTFQHLPNHEALKAKFPNDRTVQVLELYYSYAVHKSYQAVAKDIERINGWNDDARLVLLASVCARRLDGRNLARQLELGRRLVELEPKNKKFRQELEWLEKEYGKKLAKSGVAVQSRREMPPAPGKQAE